MADTANAVQQELIKARRDIAETRAAITEKLAVLEERVEETVYGVKHTFDLHYQVEQRPWLMFGGSVLVGCALGRRGNGSNGKADTLSEASTHTQPQQSIVSEVRNQLQDDLATIKGVVFGAVISTLWAMAKQVLLPSARQSDGAVTNPAAQLIDGRQITTRLINSKHNGRSEE